MAKGEGRARIGTGELEPFKDERVRVTSYSHGTNWGQREGFCENVMTEIEASENVTKLEPFKTGPEGPGRKRDNPGVPAFKERDNGIPKMPRPFSDAKCEYKQVRR
jgi:hypothetical protein